MPSSRENGSCSCIKFNNVSRSSTVHIPPNIKTMFVERHNTMEMVVSNLAGSFICTHGSLYTPYKILLQLLLLLTLSLLLKTQRRIVTKLVALKTLYMAHIFLPMVQKFRVFFLLTFFGSSLLFSFPHLLNEDKVLSILEFAETVSNLISSPTKSSYSFSKVGNFS
jgi:hypothetical protein